MRGDYTNKNEEIRRKKVPKKVTYDKFAVLFLKILCFSSLFAFLLQEIQMDRIYLMNNYFSCPLKFSGVNEGTGGMALDHSM